MGARGPLPKDTKPQIVLAADAIPDVAPPPDRSWLAPTKRDWLTFWSEPICQLVQDADLPALRRLFTLYDERGRLQAEYRKQRMTTGSTGQLVVNPAAAAIASLDTRIKELEAQFGMTPASRLRLGITLGEAARSLEQMAQLASPDDDLWANDPRVIDVESHDE
jgi:P27 family predicted phage terminase small subunit